jgi:hypothetical protein
VCIQARRKGYLRSKQDAVEKNEKIGIKCEWIMEVKTTD